MVDWVHGTPVDVPISDTTAGGSSESAAVPKGTPVTDHGLEATFTASAAGTVRIGVKTSANADPITLEAQQFAAGAAGAFNVKSVKAAFDGNMPPSYIVVISTIDCAATGITCTATPGRPE